MPVPIVLKPVEVQVPVTGALIEIRHVPVAVPVLPDRAVMCGKPSKPLPLECS